MADCHVISADSHFVEPPTMWAERIDKRFKDRAPRTVKDLPGRVGEFFVCENISPVPVASSFGAGVPSDRLREHNMKGFEAAPPSVWDPGARIKDQDRDGIRAEVIYATMGMPLYGLDDAALRSACFRAFNDWASEYCSYNPKRLLPLALITLEDINAAVAELQRTAKRGMRGAMIWAEPPDDRPYFLPYYDPFWAAAQDLNLPLSMHIFTGRKGTGIDFGKPNLARQSATIHHQIERTLAAFVLDGVLERFPKLNLVSAENDVGWAPYLMWKMDSMYERFGQAGPNPVKLSLKPSEYFRRQVYSSFISEALFLKTMDVYGVDNAMWSSDYPHMASTFPRSQEFIDENFRGISAADKRKIVCDTAARLYGID